MAPHHTLEGRGPSASRLGFAALLNLAVLGVEIAGGLGTGSLAVLANAAHLGGDIGGLALAFWAARLESAPPTARHTYGFGRSGTLAALVNALILLAMAAGLGGESVAELWHPHPVAAGPVGGLAMVGLGANLATALLTVPHASGDLNRRSVFWHALGDGMASLAVLLAAGLLAWTRWPGWDAVTGAAIAAWVGWMGIAIARESVHILMEGTPAGVEWEAVRQALLEDDAVLEVHHLHIWALAPDHNALSAHIRLNDIPLSAGQPLLDRLASMLSRRFHIEHVTLQLEAGAHPEESCQDPHEALR
ncbi:MAG: cation diffusion facilitator family transporter [Firmicutes bacterium]|nr:cation transporter [Alicyclobacillaceae bacterium]MCL6497644.1 cation diffusion facilitator family transporter [Bacillota bacterium]